MPKSTLPCAMSYKQIYKVGSLLKVTVDYLTSSSFGDMYSTLGGSSSCLFILSKSASLPSPWVSITDIVQKSISQASVLWNEFCKVSSCGKTHLGDLYFHSASCNVAIHINILNLRKFNNEEIYLTLFNPTSCKLT